MRSTGITRPCDQLGRIVIPKELRRTMQIEEGTPLEIFVDGDKIVLKKYEPACAFCGEVKDDMIIQSGKYVCPECIANLNKQVVLNKATSRRGQDYVLGYGVLAEEVISNKPGGVNRDCPK